MDEELTLVNNNLEEDNDKGDMYLVISGLLIEEELDYLVNLCNRTDRAKDNSLPLFIQTDDEEIKVGYLETSLDNLLSLYSICSNYKLFLCDGLSDSRLDLFEDEFIDGGSGFTNFIRL